MILDFGNIDGSIDAMISTWAEFRNALANNKFSYDEVDKALNCVFMRQLNDFFNDHGCKEIYTKKLSDVFITRNEVLRGTKLKETESPDYNRFIPMSEYITEDNRFSPEKVEWLYLAIGNLKAGDNIAKTCCIEECKAEKGQRFGTCHFKMNPLFANARLVDLTIGCEYSIEQLQAGFDAEIQKMLNRTLRVFKASGIKIPTDKKKIEAITGKWFSYHYAKLVSEELFLPVAGDKKYMYSPFQCLASYFMHLGFEGIIYSSVAFPKAKNVVLFDKEMAEPCGDIEIFIV